MKTIRQTYVIDASPQDVWQALTDPAFIQEWSGAEAVFEPRVGAAYELWDGSFCGKIVEATPCKKLVQTWQPDYWETEDSIVTFTLKPVGNKTRVDLLHENVEPSDYEGTQEGWDLYYLGAIKSMLEERSAKAAKKTKPAKKITSKKSASAKKQTRQTNPRR